MVQSSDNWLALMIGNSRLHWGWFQGKQLRQQWDTAHFSEAEMTAVIEHWMGDRPPDSSLPLGLQAVPQAKLPLWLASVVPQQVPLWQRYPATHLITRDQIPLANQYATLGIDRSLALWGAGQTYGFPVLVIDGGTALTLTAADEQQRIVGGAILPGVWLQLRSLAQQTAALPEVPLALSQALPPRWATNTPEAMQSGVMYALLAGVQEFVVDWLETWSEGAIAFTGGDGHWLHHHLQRRIPTAAQRLHHDPGLIFKGIAALRSILG